MRPSLRQRFYQTHATRFFESFISIRLDACGLDHRPPFFDLGPLEGGKDLRRLLLPRKYVLVECRQLFFCLQVGKRIGQSAVESSDDWLLQSLRPKERVPIRHVESRQARFIDGRNVGRRGETRARRDCEYLDGPGTPLR
jgi:hypothetical protein